jgi:hypothetical protein
MGFDLYALDDEGPSGYFRATLTGMSELRHALLEAGVFDDDAVMPAVNWPTPPDGYDERVERDDQLTESDREYEAECRRLATQPSPTPGQVAGWKLVFNDGWVVSAQECVWMADGLDRYCSQVRLATGITSSGYPASPNSAGTARRPEGSRCDEVGVRRALGTFGASWSVARWATGERPMQFGCQSLVAS